MHSCDIKPKELLIVKQYIGRNSNESRVHVVYVQVCTAIWTCHTKRAYVRVRNKTPLIGKRTEHTESTIKFKVNELQRVVEKQQNIVETRVQSEFNAAQLVRRWYVHVLVNIVSHM